MVSGISIPVILVLGCAVLSHCQRPPADDEDFMFAREGSGRSLAAPAGRPDPPPPEAGGGVYGTVMHVDQQPDYGSVAHNYPDLQYGSGYGDDDDYDYDEDYIYDEDEDYVVDGDVDSVHHTHHDPLDHDAVAPERIGVVHAAPPQPEQTELPDRHGPEQGLVYGTETRPSEQPRAEDDLHEDWEDGTEHNNGIVIQPEDTLDGAGNAIEDGTVDGRPTPHGLDGMGSKALDRNTSFFAQPGILAAVVGGAVVGLLCAILLVMLIVYRMRKKDEGSYALDEPKRSLTGNTYSKNYNKEFYA
ncbi:syndecan-like [Pollicipes pollicipes]|uniref:syndecan-like n=1 Tax=Pollicipes pollicipes TaxID=41117 RepID=UPI001884CBBA|nr:syndecan-like [Pollicipes pollicipes]